MSAEPKPAALSMDERAALFGWWDDEDRNASMSALVGVVEGIVAAREAAARREALLEAEERYVALHVEMLRWVSAVRRVEALAKCYESEAERHRNAETITIGDGARAYRAAQRADEVARSIRAALAGGDDDAEV